MDERTFDWKNLIFLLIGVTLFIVVYYAPAWPDAVDPMGKNFSLSREGKGALAIFLLAGTWWVFEVVPIGVTSLTIGVLQAMFFIRPAKEAFKDFMDPSVMFIFGSIVIGLVFTKTGLTRRLAYKMLSIVGEKTSMIYLGCFVLTSALAHIMAHTAVAATVYPLLVAIYALYGEGDKQTKFGKGMFMGMAYVAGAGSIVTLLGAARGAVALGFFKDVTGQDVGFFELTYYMFPIGWIMTFLLWGFFMVAFKPEKKNIPGLKEKAKKLYKELGGITKNEIIAASIVGACIVTLGVIAIMKTNVADFRAPNKTAVILISTVLFFITGILDVDDLEEIPWNIILLFAGAMSIGFCLWETGAAEWLAINWLTMFKESHWFIFVMSIAFFVMMMTNFIMNVAAIAISLPVALVIAPY
ncbi:MAG: SLC13/DASS family transporter, partial [Desulfobacterales bacterium]|nr:SLC13 family permease [Deltaproteobacteria bacterium]NNL41026.1 SLC13/DASS family transporter [Desulfobacterales bacterium]